MQDNVIILLYGRPRRKICLSSSEKIKFQEHKLGRKKLPHGHPYLPG
jgi:hypothetical protein